MITAGGVRRDPLSRTCSDNKWVQLITIQYEQSKTALIVNIYCSTMTLNAHYTVLRTTCKQMKWPTVTYATVRMKLLRAGLMAAI